MGRRSHIAPHRWADAAAGRVSDAQRAKLDAHADSCAECASERGRVLGARDAFDDIREQEPPRLHWDHISARIYWETSSAKHAAVREGQSGYRRSRIRPWMAIAAATATTAAFATWMLMTGENGASGNTAAAPAPSPTRVVGPTPVAPAPAAALTGVVTFAQGDVQVGGQALRFDEPLAPGARIATAAGSLSVQFGPDNGFVLAPESKLVLRAFDEHDVELVVDGSVAVDITRRKAEQRFSVVAGNRTVTVRGTAFRVVNRAGKLEVACSRGHVVVADADTEVDVLAGQSVSLAPGVELAHRPVIELSATQLASLEDSVTVAMLPVWTDAAALFATSSTLELAGPADRVVHVDGVARGSGNFAVRVMSGRHHVQSGSDDGDWIDAGAGAIARATIKAEREVPTALARRAKRRAHLEKALSRTSRVRKCLRSLEKQGLIEGSFVVLDIGVNASGSFGHMNVNKTNLPRKVARCVADMVETVSLPNGPKATIRYRLSF